MEFLQDYLGVFSSAAVAAIAAGFGGFIWKRIQDIDKLFKDAEVQGGTAAPSAQMAALRREVRDLKIIAAEASARAARALSAAGAEELAADLQSPQLEELKTHLADDVKSLHRRAANALSYKAGDITAEKLKPLLQDMKDLDHIISALNHDAMTERYRAYRSKLTDLAEELVVTTRKTKGHSEEWDAVTKAAEGLLDEIGVLTPSLQKRLSRLSIRTQSGLQTLF